jgi:hypothetical protein
MRRWLRRWLWIGVVAACVGACEVPEESEESEETSAVGAYPSGGSGSGCHPHPCPPVNHPPECVAEADPEVLWPPNHKMVAVDIVGVTDPDGDPVSIVVKSIRQDEPVNTVGDGNTAPDASGVNTSTPKVRAERSGAPHVPGDGRVYHIKFVATDPHGATCTGTVTVCVPHDQGPGIPCVDQGPLYDSTATAP